MVMVIFKLFSAFDVARQSTCQWELIYTGTVLAVSGWSSGYAGTSSILEANLW